jgi:hypothetical protein
MHRVTIQTNGINFVEHDEPRHCAAWERAVRELSEAGLIEDRGSKGQVLAVTAAGFEIVDLLPAPILSA